MSSEASAISIPDAPSGITIEATAIEVMAGNAVLARLHDGKTVRVGLIGVSTPAFHEKLLRKMSRIRVNPDRKVLAMERKSFEYLERRITSSETLVLELDESGESIVDGMMWAYVWNRGEMMNVGIIRDGYAYSKTMSPNVKHAVLLNILSGNARNKREAVLNGKAS